METFHHI